MLPEIKNSPLVSIIVLTYNHEKYIRQTVESLLFQKTSFLYEIIIAEDCGLDQTRDIVKEFANNNPKVIKTVLPDFNVGAVQQLCNSLIISSGKYIALCEGDDFWTDQEKLQKQVEILETYDQIIAVVSNASVCNNDGQIISQEKIVIPGGNKEGIYDLHAFLKLGIQYPTPTVVFRNINNKFIVDELIRMANPFLGDWILWVLLHSLGDFYYINQVTASYRLNPNSITHTANAVNRWKEDFVIRRKLTEVLAPEYRKYLNDDTNTYHMIGMAYRKNRKLLHFIYYEIRALLNNPVSFVKIVKNVVDKM